MIQYIPFNRLSY